MASCIHLIDQPITFIETSPWSMGGYVWMIWMDNEHLASSDRAFGTREEAVEDAREYALDNGINLTPLQ